MKLTAIIAAVAALSITVTSLAAHPKPGAGSVPPLIAGLGDPYHPVSTKNRLADQFFDQGLKLVYGFNHDEALSPYSFGMTKPECRMTKEPRSSNDEMTTPLSEPVKGRGHAIG